jgi:hypothetical protein
MLGYGDHHWAVRLLPFAWRIVPRWMKPGWPSRSRRPSHTGAPPTGLHLNETTVQGGYARARGLVGTHSPCSEMLIDPCRNVATQSSRRIVIQRGR